MNNDRDIESLERVVIAALSELFRRDGHLMQKNSNERSITHRLAIYIEKEISPGWDVDCEYNRNGDDPKKADFPSAQIQPPQNSAADLEARTVYPDIIIHKRGTDDNLLVIEVKKSSNHDLNAIQGDIAKVQAYLKGTLKYEHTLLLTIRTEPNQPTDWVGTWDLGGKIPEGTPLKTDRSFPAERGVRVS